MSGGTYEVNVAPPWGMVNIAAASARLGAGAGAALGSGVGTLFMRDLGDGARQLGAPCQLGSSHSRLGGAVTALAIQTKGGLRVDVELEPHPQATHERQVAVRATVPAGQQAPCHDEAREIMELFSTIAAAGWSFAGPVVEHPPGGAAAATHQGARQR